MTLSTPSGRPASVMMAASDNMVSGVWLAGLITIVQPAAIAGPILRVPMASGKFQGVIIRHGPTGPFMVEQPGVAVRRGRVAAGDPHRLLGEPAEELRAVGDLARATRPAACPSPASSRWPGPRPARSPARTPCAGSPRGPAAASRPTRPGGRRPSRARPCPSATLASATSAITSPVDGSSTGSVRPGVRRPPFAADEQPGRDAVDQGGFAIGQDGHGGLQQLICSRWCSAGDLAGRRRLRTTTSALDPPDDRWFPQDGGRPTDDSHSTVST